MFAALVGPLPKIGKMRIGRVKTMPGFVPSGDLPKQTLLAEFKKLQMQLAAMARESDGLAIDKDRNFTCVYCHAANVGSLDPPASHYLIAERPPIKRKDIK